MATLPSITRYEVARRDMEKFGVPIPPHVLRDYLDTVEVIRRAAPGLHTKVIVITRDSLSMNLRMFAESTEVNEQTADIEVRS